MARLTDPAVWIVCFVLSLGLQWQSGAWSSDFGGHADEGAHVVTSLMVRDYLAGGFLDQWNPLAFAKSYYDRYPKVAIGHYPPLFYLLAGLWTLPWRQPEAFLVLMSALSACGGYLTWRLGRSCLPGFVPALSMAVLYPLLPLVRTYTAIVMSDLLLVPLTIMATLSFSRFVDGGRWRDSLAFGLWSAAAILTKGSGLLLALVPPLTILLTGRWDLLRRWALWLGSCPVLLLAMPWMLATRGITAEGMTEGSWTTYALQAATYYPVQVVRELGPLLAALLAVGLGRLCWRLAQGRQGLLPSSLAAPWSLILALMVFFAIIPSGLDSRYLIPMVPAALILAGEPLAALAKAAPPRVVAALFVLLATTALLGSWRTVEKRYGGASEVVRRLTVDQETPFHGEATPVLVVADAAGEGALTAAAAFSMDSRLLVRRGTKELASSDWLGREYETRFQTPEEWLVRLGQGRIRWVILDEPPDWADSATTLLPHQQRLLGWLESGSLPLESAWTVPSPRRRNRIGTFHGFCIEESTPSPPSRN